MNFPDGKELEEVSEHDVTVVFVFYWVLEGLGYCLAKVLKAIFIFVATLTRKQYLNAACSG